LLPASKVSRGAKVVADQIAVVPIGVEKEGKAVISDLEKGIEKNLDADPKPSRHCFNDPSNGRLGALRIWTSFQHVLRPRRKSMGGSVVVEKFSSALL